LQLRLQRLEQYLLLLLLPLLLPRVVGAAAAWLQLQGQRQQHQAWPHHPAACLLLASVLSLLRQLSLPRWRQQLHARLGCAAACAA
jgi:hypothetical protein